MPRNIARISRDTMPLATLLESWVLALLSEGKSANTIDTYSRSVRFLIRWAGQEGAAADTGITTSQIRAFLAAEHARGAPASAATHYRNLRVFFTWLAAEEPALVPVHPMAGIARPAPPKRRKPPFNDGELRKLLAAAAGSSFEARRDTAIMRVLIDTGMRVSSLAGLEYWPSDPARTSVRIGQRLLVITRKGGHQSAVPVGVKTCAALDRYLRARGLHAHAAEPRLWLGKRGPLSVNGIREALSLRARQAGVEGMHPHRYRRTFAHQWLRSGGNELDLMNIAGWQTRTMIDVYAGEMGEDRARVAHARLSPGDRI